MEDRSLDEFLNVDDDSVGEDGERAGGDGESVGGDGETDDSRGVGEGEPPDELEGGGPGEGEQGRERPEGGENDGLDGSGIETTERGGAAVETDSRQVVDPAVSTARWDPDGGECAACGTPVRRRWQGEDGLVCGECKEW